MFSANGGWTAFGRNKKGARPRLERTLLPLPLILFLLLIYWETRGMRGAS
jgi:hypothetical protein